MNNVTENLASQNKAALEAFQSIALKSMESFEKFANLNMAATKAALSDASEHFQTLMTAKDPKAFADTAMGAAQPTAEKARAYLKHVWTIASDTNSEIGKIIELKVSESQKQLTAMVEAFAKSAPAGSEPVVTLLKNGVTAANSAYEQVSKAAKQAVATAESNFTAATKTNA